MSADGMEYAPAWLMLTVAAMLWAALALITWRRSNATDRDHSDGDSAGCGGIDRLWWAEASSADRGTSWAARHNRRLRALVDTGVDKARHRHDSDQGRHRAEVQGQQSQDDTEEVRSHLHELNALVVREPLPFAQRIEHDAFWHLFTHEHLIGLVYAERSERR